GHEVVDCRAVPMPLARGRGDDVARANLDDLPAAGLHQADSFADVERLAQRVGMPGGAGAGSEVDRVDAHARRVFAPDDDVEPDIAGEHLRGAFDGRLLVHDFHWLTSNRNGRLHPGTSEIASKTSRAPGRIRTCDGRLGNE